MSQDYDVVIGIGINTKLHVEPYINKTKFMRKICELFPDDCDDIRQQLDAGMTASFNVQRYLEEEDIVGVPEFLANINIFSGLSHANCGGDFQYLYVEPQFPWRMQEGCFPQSEGAAVKSIVDAVQAVTDLTADEIESKIDHELYEVYAF